MPLGIYLSRCSGRVDACIDIDRVLADVRESAAVVRVFDDLFDPAVYEQVTADVASASLDAVVLAGNSVEHYTRSLSANHLRDLLADAGVNPNRIVAANILEQAALAHPDDPEGATRKAKALVEVAAMRAVGAPVITGDVMEPRRAVMILGVTAEAVVAAQRLLRLGYSVVLADRVDGCERAGRANQMHATSGFVLGHSAARIIDRARLVDGDGWLGDFHLTLESPEGRETFEVGGILLARPDHTEWIDELRSHFKVDVNDDGFARSLDPSTHPAETVDPGIMVVPIRKADSTEAEKVAAADAAAMALVLRLSQEQVVHYRDVSAVDETLCGGCASCVRTCAFGACSLDESGLSQVDIRRCQGCGKCVVSCPVGARDILNSPHDLLLDVVRHLATVPVEGDKAIGFLCGGCGYPAADNASRYTMERGKGYSASFFPVRIPCGGRLDALYVLESFKVGFDAVCVFRCREGHCHNLIGNLDMDRRINLLRTVLRSRGLDDARLRIFDISPFEGEHFIEDVDGVFETVGSLTNGKGGPQ